MAANRYNEGGHYGCIMFLLTFLRLTRGLNVFPSTKSYFESTYPKIKRLLVSTCPGLVGWLVGWFLFFSDEADLARCGPRVPIVLSLYSDWERESFLEGIIREREVHVRLRAGQMSQEVG